MWRTIKTGQLTSLGNKRLIDIHAQHPVADAGKWRAKKIDQQTEHDLYRSDDQQQLDQLPQTHVVCANMGKRQNEYDDAQVLERQDG